MAGRNLQGLISLDTLSPSDKIYQGVNDDGGLVLRSGLVYQEKESIYTVTERHLVALALTEICCKLGKGKVYYFPMPKQDELDSLPSVSSRDSLVWKFHRLPKLVYACWIWGEEDQGHWRMMKHSDRLALLNARSGGISRKETVMPIDLIYDEIEKKSIRVSAYNTEDTGCMATLAIVPRPYVGWVMQFQKDRKRFELSDQGFEDGLAWHLTDHKTLEKNGCAMANGEGVVAELYNMYLAGKERSLIKHEDLLRAIIDFATAWAEAKE